MAQKIFTYILRACGYLFFSLSILFFMLWLLFPEEAVRRWVNGALAAKVPQIELKAKSVRLVFPPGLQLQPLIVGVKKGKETVPFQADFLTIRPKILASLLGGQADLLISGRILQGEFTAEALLGERGTLQVADGIIRDMQLQDQALTLFLNRTMTGTLSGSFEGTLLAGSENAQPLSADLLLTEARLSLQEPVLGHDAFDLNKVSVRLAAEGDGAKLTGGKVESPLFSGSFEGEVSWSVTGRGNQLMVTGILEPRPELFAKLGDAKMTELLMSKLKTEDMPFAVSGTLQRPGISFGPFDDLLQSGNQKPRG